MKLPAQWKEWLAHPLLQSDLFLLFIGLVIGVALILLIDLARFSSINRKLDTLQPAYRQRYLTQQMRHLAIRHYLLLFACLITFAAYLHHNRPAMTNSKPRANTAAREVTRQPADEKQLSPSANVIVPPEAVIFDLFQGDSANGAQGASLNTTKADFEAAFNAAYVLERCGHDTQNAESRLRTLLNEHMTALFPGAEAQQRQMARRIEDSAYGAYELFYHLTPCDSIEAEQIVEQLQHFIRNYQPAAPRTAPAKN